MRAPRYLFLASLVAAVAVAGSSLLIARTGRPSTSGPGKFAYAIPPEPGFAHGIYLQEVDGSGRVDLLAGIDPAFDWDFPVAFASDGSRVAIASRSESEPAIAVLDVATRELRRYRVDEKPFELAWAPDGTRVAYTPRGFEPGSDVHVLSLANGTVVNLTNDEGIELDLAWSPDGKWIAYRGCVEPCDQDAAHIVAADGSITRRLSSEGHTGPPAWSADSRRVAFTMFTSDGTAAARWLHVADIVSGRVTAIGTVRRDSDFVAWLPDGSLLTHGEEPRGGVQILNPAANTARSLAGDSWPVRYQLSPDGKYAAYANAASISVVDLGTGERRVVPALASPQVLGWLPLAAAPGASLESLAPITVPRSTGEFPALAAGETDGEGWPIVDCPRGASPYRAETRRATVCVPTGFELSGDRHEASGQWVPHWSFRRNGGDGVLMLVLGSLAHPEPLGFPAQCALPRQATMFGVPAYLCVETFEDSPIPETYLNHGTTWHANAEARTGEYFVRMRITGGHEPAEAKAIVDEVLAALASSRIGEPVRIEP